MAAAALSVSVQQRGWINARGANMSRRRRAAGTAALAVALAAATLVGTTPGTSTAAGARRSAGAVDTKVLSAGGRAWFEPPTSELGRVQSEALPRRIAFGGNVDANDPQKDLAAGQSETAIAAARATVVAAWNDSSGFLVQPSTDRRASVTGLGVSVDGGRHFRDLEGLRNNEPNQQWFGDPTVVRLDSSHFAVGSLYLPPQRPDCSRGHATRFQLAVEIVTVHPDGSAALGLPVVVADGGNACPLFDEKPKPAPNLAFLDKEWLSYDRTSRTLAMSYTRFFMAGGHSGAGQIEMVRAHLPAEPGRLTSNGWSKPIIVWPEEPTTVNQGSYVSLARNGDAYVAWERNVNSNLFNGDPYVYIHAARIPRGDVTPVVGGPARPRVVTLGQRNSNGAGGVKSLGSVIIAGYNRGLGQDFPRIAVNSRLRQIVVVWNDASKHPLGDIWMRALPMNLSVKGRIVRVNDDGSFALHFLPAVSVRSDGSVATSWYDRRLSGPDSTRTHYFAEIRTTPTSPAKDFRITTGPTDWAAASTLITPNFGDYTDNASSGSTTYYTWSDGRIGVPQPFVDRHR
jgi:hypothetical protein